MRIETNIGAADRLLRLIIGATLIAMAATGVVGWWGWIGVLPIVTAIVRFCPAYTLLGFKTCRTC